MILQDLEKEKLISPPKWLVDNTVNLSVMGSEAYGVTVRSSDIDVYGIVVPPKDLIFPHLKGQIDGFGRQIQRFDCFQQHHIHYKEKQYDFSVYSIVRYLHLAMEGNPNIIDSLFVPRRCVLHSTEISERIRERRKLFLSKNCYIKFRGYAYAQLSKIENKTNSSNPTRADLISKYGFDTKFSGHTIRLALEAEQILSTGDLDLERDREIIKSVRRGEWSLERIRSWFQEKERSLAVLHDQSNIRSKVDEDEIKKLLIECLEIHYGSLDKVIAVQRHSDRFYEGVAALVEEYRK